MGARKRGVIGTDRLLREIETTAGLQHLVIQSTLRYFQIGGSDWHLRDIARMLEISGSELDQSTRDRWIARRTPQRRVDKGPLLRRMMSPSPVEHHLLELLEAITKAPSPQGQ